MWRQGCGGGGDSCSLQFGTVSQCYFFNPRGNLFDGQAEHECDEQTTLGRE